MKKCLSLLMALVLLLGLMGCDPNTSFEANVYGNVRSGRLVELTWDDCPKQMRFQGLLLPDPLGTEQYFFVENIFNEIRYLVLPKIEAPSTPIPENGTFVSLVYDRDSQKASDIHGLSGMTLVQLRDRIHESCAPCTYEELMEDPIQQLQISGIVEHAEESLEAVDFQLNVGGKLCAVHYRKHTPEETFPKNGDAVTLYGRSRGLLEDGKPDLEAFYLEITTVDAEKLLAELGEKLEPLRQELAQQIQELLENPTAWKESKLVTNIGKGFGAMQGLLKEYLGKLDAAIPPEQAEEWREAFHTLVSNTIQELTEHVLPWMKDLFDLSIGE